MPEELGFPLCASSMRSFGKGNGLSKVGLFMFGGPCAYMLTDPTGATLLSVHSYHSPLEDKNNTDMRVMKKQHWAMTGELGFSLCSSGMRSLAIYFSVDFKSFFLSLV